MTYFLPSERATEAELQAAVRAVELHPVTKAVLEAFSGAVLILNSQRRIIASNLGFLAEYADHEQLIGNRVGEALQCVTVCKAPAGCGTGRDCSKCGAALAMLESTRAGPIERECTIRLTPRAKAAPRLLELKVRATYLKIAGQDCIVMCLQDISDTKRRHHLERVFFHDVLNTGTALTTAAELLQREPSLVAKLGDRLARLSKRLVREITDQRDNLTLHPKDLTLRLVRVSEIFSDLRHYFEVVQFESGRTLVIKPENDSATLKTDRTLLVRVLTNMMKNAFEATTEGAEVRVWCEVAGSSISFKVWNKEQMSPEVSEHVFERNFSTKGSEGRGLGTYSMSLLGETYLGGKVGFETSPGGTVFFVTLPSA